MSRADVFFVIFIDVSIVLDVSIVFNVLIVLNVLDVLNVRDVLAFLRSCVRDVFAFFTFIIF